jgi:beta-glucanase (GH16 family)
MLVLAGLAYAWPLLAAPPANYQLQWSDEFDGPMLDTNKWVHWLPGKRNDSLNVPDAVTVSNGLATLTTYTEGGKHFTGMISTQGKFEPVHGYWEARVAYTDSVGMWSAFWLQSPTMGRPLGDPGKAGVEIDICEHRQVSDKGENLAEKVQHTLHWDGYGQQHKSKGHLTPAMHLDDGFHIYGCEITEAGYKFFVDGQLTWTVTEAASNAKEFAILSSEIKAGAWAGEIPASGYGNRDTSRMKMTVDYVRYYASP